MTKAHTQATVVFLQTCNGAYKNRAYLNPHSKFTSALSGGLRAILISWIATVRFIHRIADAYGRVENNGTVELGWNAFLVHLLRNQNPWCVRIVDE